MPDSARTLGPSVMVVLSSLASAPAPARNRNAMGKATAVTAAAVASHLSTGLLPASGSGKTHRPLSAPGAQPMQATPAASRKTPEVANDDLPSAEESLIRRGCRTLAGTVTVSSGFAPDCTAHAGRVPRGE